MMTPSQPLPSLWLLSDARNDAVLEAALKKLPQRSGFVFRHYHLAPVERRERFETLARIARERGHSVVLSRALGWGEDGAYGAPDRIADASGLRLATAHDAGEVATANRIGADGVFLSPVFATRSHAGGQVLGVGGFRHLAASAIMPAIALGGMTAQRAAAIGCERWGAVDGLVSPNAA